MYRILLADTPDICGELSKMVDWNRLGFETVVSAHSFQGALELAVAHQPQVALVGMELGERMGFELVAALRGLGLPTVCCILSNRFGGHDLRRALRAGCRDILREPPDPLSLKEFLEWAVVSELHGRLAPGGEPERDPVLGVPADSLSRVTNRILAAVRSGYRESLSLTAIARSLEMSSKYIGRVFLQDTGMRFSQYLTAYRMLEARRLLSTTGEKVSVIAAAVGYPQLNNFYTHFRQYFGISPGAMRGNLSSEEATP